jgi:hypothetical protein
MIKSPAPVDLITNSAQGDFIMRRVIMFGLVRSLTALAPGLLADEKSPAEKAPADWLYPGAKVVSFGISSGKGGAVSCVVQETADDVPKTLRHYGDKLGNELKLAQADAHPLGRDGTPGS